MLHDTRTGRPVPLEPREPGKVAIYACGPTVYDRIHVGNARPFVVFSLLKRFLLHEGYHTTFVANVTDVNDKIYEAARAQDIPSGEMAAQMTALYVEDTDALGLGRPDFEPKATDTIAEIIELIGALIERGHAYAVDGDVYFGVRSYPSYGELSHRNPDAMDQGEDVEGASRKRDPLDFALWKGEKEGEDTAWDAPWGRGRPGWHIECSAMAETLLGLDFEVHGGGNDLIFPHHENELAQTVAARGEPLARIWMHNGMVQLDREKMSKSVGNIFALHRALEVYGRDALLLYLSSAHYRGPIAFGDEELDSARRSVARIREAGRRLVPGPSPAELAPLRERFFAALADDFHTEQGLAAIFEWVRAANSRTEPTGADDLREMLDVLGLANLLDAEAGPAPDEQARALLDEREAARGARDFAAADRLRDELRTLGWEVRDGSAGPELLPVR
ncbi:MAG: cysteinyl-tRNA synthetase [Solirubrobacterales bacterium]|jgi:cysteinyl-tRNA synthetase|nr:cysteinyl-tRNA synthetase [Solirubrobacterales bacterium]